MSLRSAISGDVNQAILGEGSSAASSDQRDGRGAELTATEGVSVVEHADATSNVEQSCARSRATTVLRALDEQRRSIARDLHDELGQALTALQLDLASLLEESAQDRDRLIEGLSKGLEDVRRLIASVQGFAGLLRPAILAERELATAVEFLAREFERRSGIRCEVILDLDMQSDRERDAEVYCIVREALTNVARHAHAHHATIQLRNASNRLLLDVTDDGVGIPKMSAERLESFGLIGIQERATALGGWVEIADRLEGGTRLACVLPLEVGH